MGGWHLGEAKTVWEQWQRLWRGQALRNTGIERAEGGGGPEGNTTSSQRPPEPRT